MTSDCWCWSSQDSLWTEPRRRGKTITGNSTKNWLKGARSRYFSQFQHWSNCHRINLNIKITDKNYRRTLTKHRKDKKGRGWTKLERIEVDCIWINLTKSGPTFSNLRYVSLYIIKLSLPQLENHSQLLIWGHDFANERLLVCQFDV